MVCGGLTLNRERSVDRVESRRSISGAGRAGPVAAPFAVASDCGWESGTRSADEGGAIEDEAVGRGGVWSSAGEAFCLLLLGGRELGSCRKDAEGLSCCCGCCSSENGMSAGSGGASGMGKTL